MQEAKINEVRSRLKIDNKRMKRGYWVQSIMNWLKYQIFKVDKATQQTIRKLLKHQALLFPFFA